MPAPRGFPRVGVNPPDSDTDPPIESDTIKLRIIENSRQAKAQVMSCARKSSEASRREGLAWKIVFLGDHYLAAAHATARCAMYITGWRRGDWQIAISALKGRQRKKGQDVVDAVLNMTS